MRILHQFSRKKSFQGLTERQNWHLLKQTKHNVGFRGKKHGCATSVKARGSARKEKMTKERISSPRTLQFERTPGVNYQCEGLMEGHT